MVCLPFKPAAGTNVPANIRIVDEAHTKMLWKVLATKSCRKILADLHFQNVVWKVQKSLCQLEQNQVKVIMMHGLAWSEAPLLCKRKSIKVGDCLWSCLGLLDLLFICPTT
ncbi:uncharacterized protein [Procambarus clarkii]|uniref:uncharacterized protein isoform X2 n=1 Tax=Procambarus clarkii TaxID=6728 RepID=UPI003743980C